MPEKKKPTPTAPVPGRLIDQRIRRRAIDIHEGETVPVAVFKALVKAAVARNMASSKKR